MIITAQGLGAFDAAVPETAGDKNAVRFLQLVKCRHEHLRPSAVKKFMQRTHKDVLGFVTDVYMHGEFLGEDNWELIGLIFMFLVINKVLLLSKEKNKPEQKYVNTRYIQGLSTLKMSISV